MSAASRVLERSDVVEVESEEDEVPLEVPLEVEEEDEARECVGRGKSMGMVWGLELVVGRGLADPERESKGVEVCFSSLSGRSV
jgi:hypothetical protein